MKRMVESRSGEFWNEKANRSYVKCMVEEAFIGTWRIYDYLEPFINNQYETRGDLNGATKKGFEIIVSWKMKLKTLEV